jgi:G2/mitotic-specific cyclin-B, other
MVNAFYNPVTNGSAMLRADVCNIDNPQYIGEFAHSNQLTLQRESNIKSKYASENCMGLQEEIHVKMRRILVDWLIDVHMKFKLLPETLFITINLVDRYSQHK